MSYTRYFNCSKCRERFDAKSIADCSIEFVFADREGDDSRNETRMNYVMCAPCIDALCKVIDQFFIS